MSRLQQGEREFVSGPGDPAAGPHPSAPARGAAAPAPAVPALGPDDVDARGASPPLPLLRAHRALRMVPPGGVVRVLTNYPSALLEFQAMAKYLTHCELVSQDALGEEMLHVFRRRR